MKRQTFVEHKLLFVILLSFSFVFAFAGAMFQNSNDNTMHVSGKENINVTVIIDAGHGGEDGGAVGTTLGTLEKDINLSLSYKLCELFALTDIKAVMTRRDDRLLYNDGQEHRKKYHDVRNRVKFAQDYESPVFISIHQNKFPVSKYKGLQVYYSGNNDESKILAEKIQSYVVTNIQKDNNRKIKESGGSIYLMNALECPAVLVECGFLSNSEDEKNLCDDEYQNKLAFVIFASIMSYISENQL